MDITVENINDLELPADLETALLSKLEPKVSPFLTGKGFVVKPQTEYDTAIKTASDAAVKLAVGEEGAKLYGGVDEVVALALGVTKPDGMRTRVWLQQLETEGKLPLSDDNIAKIRAAVKGNSQTKDAVVEELRKKLEETETATSKAKTEAFEKAVKVAINADLRNAPVLIDPALKDAQAIANAKNVAVGELKSYFTTFYEGKEDSETGETFYVKKGTDKALMNVAENRPMTPTEIFRAFHPMYLAPAGHTQTGGGTGKPPVTGGTPGAFKTVSEITKYAIETKGFAAFTPEFDKFVKDERTKAGL